MRRGKETELSVDQLSSFMKYAKNQPMTASQISYRFGVYADGVIDTVNQNPDIFNQKPNEDKIIYYSLKEESINTPDSQNTTKI